MATSSHESESFIPLSSLAQDGWSKEDEATATCFCGAVQLAFVSIVILLQYTSTGSNTSEPSGSCLPKHFIVTSQSY